MHLNEFQSLAQRTAPELGSNHFFPVATIPVYAEHTRNVDLVHAAFGVAGEAGELCDPIKKAMFYGKPLDVENIKEEAGDILWYIALLCRALDCTMDDLCVAVIAKLQKRYPDKYTDAAAIARADKTPDPQNLKAMRPLVETEWRRTEMPPWVVRDIEIRYSKYSTVEEGYYFDDDAKVWIRIPELWEQIPDTRLRQIEAALSDQHQLALSCAKYLQSLPNSPQWVELGAVHNGKKYKVYITEETA